MTGDSLHTAEANNFIYANELSRTPLVCHQHFIVKT